MDKILKINDEINIFIISNAMFRFVIEEIRKY